MPLNLSTRTVLWVRAGGIDLMVPAEHADIEMSLGLARIRLDVLDLTVLCALSRGASDIADLVSVVSADVVATSDEIEKVLERLQTMRLVVDSVEKPLADRGRVSRPPSPLGPLEGEFVHASHLVVVLRNGIFLALDHLGAVRHEFNADELHLLACFGNPTSIADAISVHREAYSSSETTDASYRELLSQLLAVGLLRTFDPDDLDYQLRQSSAAMVKSGLARRMRVQAQRNRISREFEERRLIEDEALGVSRIVVVPVEAKCHISPPASLGALMAYARSYDEGRLGQIYAFHDRFATEVDFKEVPDEARVYLFSDYIWNIDENRAISKQVKEHSPESITIHGGPSAPAYPEDVERFFEDNPHVDIVVHGEGEQTLVEILDALAGAFGDTQRELGVLADVAGLTYRSDSGVVRTAPRERLSDLSALPSAILMGLFDYYKPGPPSGVNIETNRGCPYGCTFCDWGSATLSRIRKFDMARVSAEIEWIGEVQADSIGLCDANFGIMDRDVEIAQMIVDTRVRHGFPRAVSPNYAKNTVKHLRKIVGMWAECGILTSGKLSLQTIDDETLAVIRRKNIKTERYNDLATEFEENSLPLSVELMMGLPGSTVETFSRDIQEVIDRGLQAWIYPTVLLPNSPMNKAEYRLEHGIVARPHEELRESNTYSHDDWKHMVHLRSCAIVLDICAIGRFVSRWVRQETGRKEIDLYADLVRTVVASPEEWPALSYVMRSMTVLGPPGSWQLYLDELKSFVTGTYGLAADDSALCTAFEVQRLMLPAETRSFPESAELMHDYAQWYQDLTIDRRTNGHDWPERVARLCEYGPGRLTVDDPDQVSQGLLGIGFDGLTLVRRNWELTSAVGRPWFGPSPSVAVPA